MNSGRQKGQVPKPVQQQAQHPQGGQCTWTRSRILLVQNPHMTQQTCRTWTHICLLLDHVASASLRALQIPTSNQLSWNPREGITELKDIVAKKLTDDKADNPPLDFCDFLKVEVVQLTSDSYDEFQQEMFNLLMRLKRSDKQQTYYHRMGMSTTVSSQASNHYPVSHTQMQAQPQQMPQTFTQVPLGHPQQQHSQHSQQHCQQTFTQPPVSREIFLP